MVNMTTKNNLTSLAQRQEQEAIDTIILLLSKVRSKSGISSLVEIIQEKGKDVLEEELAWARGKVKELEKSLKFFGISAEGDDDEKEEEKKEEPPPQENRPVFSVNDFEEVILRHFVIGQSSGFEFSMSEIKDVMETSLNLGKKEIEFMTENGSNLFTSCIRNTLRSLVNKEVIKRVKPGLYMIPHPASENAVISWDA